MKKLFLSISAVFLVLFGAMTISASAARYNSLPITINQEYYGSTTLFTLTDLEVYVDLNESPKYTKTASIYVAGEFNKGSSVALSFYFYDASGKHIASTTKTIYSSDFEGYEDGIEWAYVEFDIPDVAATLEVGTSYPGSWNNTYYYCKYMNVHSDDGRALGIHDMLLPVYENCGWHGPVTMYALDGRETEVPYCDIKAYQKVGWYLWEDYYFIEFKKSFDSYMRNGNYSNAFYLVNSAISELTGTSYESTLYFYKTNVMDSWRAKTNGPLAYCSSYISSNSQAHITFRNVSYKTVKAYKVQFDCYDVFNTYLGTRYYQVTNNWISSSDTLSLYYNNVPSKTDHIANIKVTQVVYSDGTSWYR